jgi:hypothetical protein
MNTELIVSCLTFVWYCFRQWRRAARVAVYGLYRGPRSGLFPRLALSEAAREVMSTGGSGEPAYTPLVATELARSSSAPSSAAATETAGAPRSANANASALIANASGAGAGLAPTVTVTLNRTNHDPYRAFVQGTFVEEGYVHLSPKPLGATPYDGMLRCVWVVFALPGLLTCALIMVAHSGWWTVTAATTEGGGSSGEEAIMVTVPVGDTAQFRAIVAFVSFLGATGWFAYARCVLIHRELGMSAAPGVSVAERLARFADMQLDLRLFALLWGCLLIHVALRPPFVHPVGVILCQILGGSWGVLMFAHSGYKYAGSLLLVVAAPFVRDKTSLRAEMARKVRAMIVAYLISLVVFVRFAAFFILQTDVIPMPIVNPCAFHGNTSMWEQLIDDDDCIDRHEFQGRAQCEVNLLAFPFASLMVTSTYTEHSSAMSLTNALTKMTTESLPTVALILVFTIPIVLNIVAISIGESDDGVCDGLAYTTWAWPSLFIAPMTLALLLGVPPNLVEQHCPSKALRKANCAYRSFLNYVAQEAEQVAIGGVREARWELRGEFACFLSHFKDEAAGDARHLKDKLFGMLNAPVFLDSDDLLDLRELLKIVARSDVLVLLQTTNVLTRPWCLLEIYTAICNHVPIVAVAVEGSFPYSFDEATALLDDIDESSFAERLASRHPGAVDIIRKHPIPVRGVFHDVDIEELGRSLKNHLPNL